MERQFNNGDFEKLLRDNANQYRMYPSEKVWKGIDSALHTRRRWYGLTAAIMFLITGSVVSIIIFNDKSSKNNITEQKNISNQKTSQPQSSLSAAAEQRHFTPEIKKPVIVNVPVSDLTKTYLNNHITANPMKDSEEERINPDQNNLSGMLDTDMPSSINEEPYSFFDPMSFHLNLRNDNTRVATEKQENSSNAINEKMIGEQSSVHEDVEKKINDAISALASQNISTSKQKKQARVTAQIYFTPTVSYRNLTENKRVLNGNGYYVPVIDLNNLVKHKPAMGLEFGIEGRYRINKNFSIKTGLQFNINRYDIRAYSHPTEIATVALNSGSGVDSLATLSNYRNFNGNSANWLENFYFQTSIPVGAEIILGTRNNIQWGISATIQPTYVIGDRAYVISSDYKNYAKFPDLMRRWNISTGVGTFVSYSTGRIRWQAGPHVRYQHLSSFVNALTIKEKLYAIGLRVGATLNKK